MHILFLADAVFEDLPGGSRMAAREIARLLAGRGHRITFLVARLPSSKGDDENWQEGIRIVRYGGAGRIQEYLRSGKQTCARIWQETPFDLVHTHFAYAALGPLRAVPGFVPRVRTFHGPWEEESWVEETAGTVGPSARLAARLKKYIRRAIEAANLSRSERIITLSDCYRRQVLARYAVPGESVHTISGGTDIQRFTPTEDKQAVRQALNLPPHCRLVLSIRRLCPRMGLHNLVEAMPALLAQHPDVLLLIGGQGPERKHLEQRIREQRLENSVRLIGFVPDELLASYYQAADLFVLPTVALEGFGLVTTEALACGTPVIGTNVGATPEILLGLSPDLIVPGTTPQALARTILKFWETDRPAELSPTCLHDYVCRHYTWEQHVRQVEAVYESVLTQDHPRRTPHFSWNKIFANTVE
jgi:glycosyltransferase involved in cell wall biosynthesis